MRKYWKKYKLYIVCAPIAVVLAIHFVLDVGCVWRKYFHIVCPACGLTRALYAALRLDFAAAFHYHPMFPGAGLLAFYLLKNGNCFKIKLLNNAVLVLIALGFLGVWIYRLIFGADYLFVSVF